MTDHDIAHCTGYNARITCQRRETCARYAAHLEAKDAQIDYPLCYLMHRDNIINGCTEYEPLGKKEHNHIR